MRAGGVLGSALIALSLLAAGCGGASVEKSSLPLRQDFSDCGDLSMNDDVATIDCPDGELRVVVAKPEVSATHFIPHRFDARPEALTISADAHATSVAGVWGIGCLASEAGEPARGYALLVLGTGAV